MKRSAYRIRDYTGEYVVLDAWDADAFASDLKLAPLDYSEAGSRIARWAREPAIGRELRRRILGASPRTEFHPGAAERALEDAFRLAWKLFKIPRAEHQSVKLDDDAIGPSQAYVPPPPPPPSEQETPAKTWFEVKIVDVYGDPVSDADVVFSQSGKQQKAKTNSAGVATWKDVDGPSFASVKLSSPKDVKESLAEVWGKKKAKEGLEGEKLSIAENELVSSLVSETPKVIILYKPLTRVRLIGTHFDTNKCFLRPTAIPALRMVVSEYQAKPTGKLLVLGHTDTVADDAYNLDLSVERAESVSAYLRGDAAAWEAWFEAAKPAQKRWGDYECKQMISALPCEQTVAGFQKWSNDARGTDLKVDGIAGPKTRRALIDAYMALEGTSLSSATKVSVHGCGEFFPRTDEGDEYGKDGVAAEENRRVELLCFDDEIVPPVPGLKATKGEPEYQQWKNQITKSVDVGGGPGSKPFFVSILAPTSVTNRLLVLDENANLLRAFEGTEGERQGSQLTFEINPSEFPGAVYFAAQWNDHIEPASSLLQLGAEAAELSQGDEKKLGATSFAADASVTITVDVDNPSHHWVSQMEVTLSIPGVGPIKAKDKSKWIFEVPKDATNLELEATIRRPLPKGTITSPPKPILKVTQTLKFTTATSGKTKTKTLSYVGGPKGGMHRRIREVQLTGQSATNVHLHIDTRFLNVTEWMKEHPVNPTYPTVPADVQGNIFEYTGKDGPTTWYVKGYGAVEADADLRQIPIFMMLRHELRTFVDEAGKTIDPLKGAKKMGHTGTDDADLSGGIVGYMTLTDTDAGPVPFKYVRKMKGVHRFDEFPHKGWHQQFTSANKKLLFVMPLPHNGSLGIAAAPTLLSPKPVSTTKPATSSDLDGLLLALWDGGLLANSAAPEAPTKGRFAIGAFSSGTEFLVDWINSPLIDDKVDEIYYFDGRLDVKNMTEKPADADKYWPRDDRFKKWFSTGDDHRVRFFGTSYTEYTARATAKMLGPNSRVSAFPESSKFWYENDSLYTEAFKAGAAGGDLLGFATYEKKTKDKLRQDDLGQSASEVTGVVVTKRINPTTSPTVDVHSSRLEVARYDVAAGKQLDTKSIERASEAEATAVFRYEASRGAALPLDQTDFLAACASFVSSGTDEIHLVSRLRHSWSTMGRFKEPGTTTVKGVIEWCMHKSGF